MNRHLDRIAVTGGTGFIGRGVLKALQRRGARVSALLRPGGQPPTDAPKDTVWIEGRLGDASAEAALLQDAEAVIHLAGLTKALSRSAFLEINAAAAGALAERAAAAGVKRFVLASSIAARAPEMSDYAASKRAGEDAVRSAAGDMDALIVRLPAIIGADDAATRPLVQALRAGVFPVPGGEAGRRARFSLAHVDDIARALVDWTLEGADDQ